jgi:hypothetical protein
MGSLRESRPPTAVSRRSGRCIVVRWRRAPNGALVGGVFDVVAVEQHRRLRYVELASSALLFEFTLAPEPGGCRVEVAGWWHEEESAGAVKRLVRRWVQRLPNVVFTRVDPLLTPLHLLEGPGPRPRELVRQIDKSLRAPSCSSR